MTSWNKAGPETVETMRRLVENTHLTLNEIASHCCVTGGTVSRYARERGWRRPALAMPAPESTAGSEEDAPAAAATGPRWPADRRRALANQLWDAAYARLHAVQLGPGGRARPVPTRDLVQLTTVMEKANALEAEIRAEEEAAEAAAARHGDAGRGERSDEDDADDIVAMRHEIARRFERFCQEEGHWDLLELLTGQTREEWQRRQAMAEAGPPDRGGDLARDEAIGGGSEAEGAAAAP